MKRALSHHFIALALLSALASSTTNATTLQSHHQIINYLKQGEFNLQLGAYDANQGTSQHVPITGLIGNDFSVTNSSGKNVLFGLGYYRLWLDMQQAELKYGINAFYFPQTSVKGNIIQEKIAPPNLSYRYNISNLPIYLAIKAIFKNNENYRITLDGGLGINMISTSNYSESPLNSFTIPDHMYKGTTQTDWSAMIGVGVRFNNIPKFVPVEIGYRFFYLGQGQLGIGEPQVGKPLYTGYSSAQALVVSIVL